MGKKQYIPLDNIGMVNTDHIKEIIELVESEKCIDIIDELIESEVEFMSYINEETRLNSEYLLKNNNIKDKELLENIDILLKKFTLIGFLVAKKTYLYDPNEDESLKD